MRWANDALNHTATTANAGNKSSREMWYGTAAHASPHPFLRPAYCRWKRPSKLFPTAESCFYFGPGIDHPSDSLRILTRVSKVIEKRDVTWEATPHAGAPSPPLPETPEQGGTMKLGDPPKPGGTNYFASAPTTPLPVLGRGIPHQLRAVSPLTQASDELQAEGVELNGSSTSSIESSGSDSSYRDGSDASSSDDGAPTGIRTRTASRQLGAHMSGPGDGEEMEVRERKPRRLTRKWLRD